MKKGNFFKTYYKHLIIWVLIITAIIISLRYGVDRKAVVFGTVTIGVFTQAFASLSALVAVSYTHLTLPTILLV